MKRRLCQVVLLSCAVFAFCFCIVFAGDQEQALSSLTSTQVSLQELGARWDADRVLTRLRTAAARTARLVGNAGSAGADAPQIERYATWREAENGHARWVARLQDAQHRSTRHE
jgi:hypothetical protein